MFGKLFGKKKAPPEAAITPLSPGIRSSILQTLGSKGIPPMQGAAQKAFQLATDPTADARSFVEVIESDEALSARVLRIANSVFFDRGKRSTTIEESVTVIGLEELRCILNANSLSELFPSTHPLRAQFWVNDIATGIIAKHLAKSHLPDKAEFVFLAGLMHDIGKLLLLQRAPEIYQKVVSVIEKSGVSFSEAEMQCLVFNHAEVGHLIGEHWGFSVDLLDVIRHHHDVQIDTLQKITTAREIVAIADTFAHALGLGHSKHFAQFQQLHMQKIPHLCELLQLKEGPKAALQLFLKAFENESPLYLKGSSST